MLAEPVIIAVPPKGGSLDDVFARLVAIGWIDRELADAIRGLVKADKNRIKLEAALISAWRAVAGDGDAALARVVAAGHDEGQARMALARMRRYEDAEGTRLAFTPKAGVDELLHGLRHDRDPVVAAAALALHLELDLGRYGRPTRMMFDHLEFDFADGGRQVRGVLVGTEHEVTPTYLRKHKRDCSLTCYDAFHNTLLDALSTGRVRNWRELMDHLIEANTDVRIVGSLGLDDYLGHFVLMPEKRARAVVSLGGGRRWGGVGDPKVEVLAREPVLIDAQYEEVYRELLDGQGQGLVFESTTDDIERLCVEKGRSAIYIVRSGGTIARTPGLCVVGEELITSETIVAVNQERHDHNPGVGLLVESLEPRADDHSEAWRARLASRLGESLL